MPADVDGPITRSTIEAKLRELKGEVDTTVESARPFVMIAGVVAAVAVVSVAYLLGKRKGKKKTTLVEVRRV